jgi:hypothetical protein
MPTTVAEIRSLCLRVVYAVCLSGGTWTHLQVALVHGLWWDYGGAGLVTRVYWTALLFLDPLAALLLLVKPRLGLIACASIIVTDVLHNTWFVLHNPMRIDLYLAQIAFLLFVAFTVRTAWKGAPRSRHARLGVWQRGIACRRDGQA